MFKLKESIIWFDYVMCQRVPKSWEKRKLYESILVYRWVNLLAILLVKEGESTRMWKYGISTKLLIILKSIIKVSWSRRFSKASHYVDVWQLIDSICIILQNSLSYVVHACSIIMLQNSLPMQPYHSVFAYLCLQVCPYTKKLLWENLVFQLSSLVLVLYLLCRTHKEFVWRFSFHHSRVKFVIPHELLAKNTRSLARDLNKIGEQTRVIKNECQVCFELYRMQLGILLLPQKESKTYIHNYV